MASIATRLIPAWLRHYSFATLPADVIAGLVVGILVIPQSLGYAVLAGLPPCVWSVRGYRARYRLRVDRLEQCTSGRPGGDHCDYDRKRFEHLW